MRGTSSRPAARPPVDAGARGCGLRRRRRGGRRRRGDRAPPGDVGVSGDEGGPGEPPSSSARPWTSRTRWPPSTGPRSTAAQIQVDKINEAGGIDGRQVELEVIDHQLDPERTKSAAIELIDGPGADVLLVTCDVDYATPAVQEAITRGVLAVPPLLARTRWARSASATPGKLAFSIGNVAQDEGAAMAEYAIEKGWMTAATVTDNVIVYFQDVVKAFTALDTELLAWTENPDDHRVRFPEGRCDCGATTWPAPRSWTRESIATSSTRSRRSASRSPITTSTRSSAAAGAAIPPGAARRGPGAAGRVRPEPGRVRGDAMWPVEIADALRGLIHQANLAREQSLPARSPPLPTGAAAPVPQRDAGRAVRHHLCRHPPRRTQGPNCC